MSGRSNVQKSWDSEVMTVALVSDDSLAFSLGLVK